MEQKRYGLLLFALLVGLVFGGGKLWAQQNQTDLFVASIDVPTGMIPVDQAIRPAFTVENGGPENVQMFLCGVQIFDVRAGQPVFQEQIEITNLNNGQTRSVQTQNAWTPANAGPFVVQVNIFFNEDTNPNNNSAEQEFEVVDESGGLLSLAEAIQILNTQVLDNHPMVDSLMALHLSPPANPADSIVPPGLVIASSDSAVNLSYNEPVYFFFVDLYPGEFFEHPVEYIAISAIDGSIDRQPATIWPTIDGAVPNAGFLCDNEPQNPRLVRGNRLQCAEKPNPYVPAATENKQDWALVVVGALFKDIEEKTVQQDICMFKERMNGGQYGPKIDKDNIKVHDGPTNRGLTEKELCDAIEWFKGKACRKFYFKYIAHGLDDTEQGGRNRDPGIVLWKDSTRTSTVKLTWKDLACKLKEAGIRNACIEITACYSGKSIPAFRAKKIRGTVITSSSGTKPTPVGDGSGTWWEKALFACSKDKSADFDKNDTIDQNELYGWVLLQHKDKPMGHDNPLRPMPQRSDLTDSIKSVKVSIKCVEIKKFSIGDTRNGSATVILKRRCVSMKPKRGRARAYYRNSMYLQNKRPKPLRAKRHYRILIRCGNRVDTLWRKKKGELLVGINSTVCIVNIPDSCVLANGKVRMRLDESNDEKDWKSSKGWQLLSAADQDEVLTLIQYEVPHDPGDFLLYNHEFQPDDSSGAFVASVQAPTGWEPQLPVSTFTIPEGDTSRLFMTGAYIPDTATVGGTIRVRITSLLSSDTTELDYTVYFRDTLRATTGIEEPISGAWRWYDVAEHTRLHSKSVMLQDARIEVQDTLDIEGVGNWMLHNVAISADDTVTLNANVGLGSTRAEWSVVALRGASEGLVVEGGVVHFQDVLLGASGGDGLLIKRYDGPNDTLTRTRVEKLEAIDIVGAARHGAVFENLGPDTVWAEALYVTVVDSNDVVVRRSTDVACLNCDYREAAVSVDTSSSLSRYISLSIVTADTAGEGFPNVAVRVVDSLGQEVWAGTTDAEGFSPELEVLISRHDKNGFQSFAPFVVSASNGTTTQYDTVHSTTWSQVLFTVTEDVDTSTSVPGAGWQQSSGRISRVVPQPVSAGDGFTVQTEGLSNRRLSATLHNSVGEQVWSASGLRLTNGQLRVAGVKSLPSGVYVLQLHVGNGEVRTTQVVVQ